MHAIYWAGETCRKSRFGDPKSWFYFTMFNVRRLLDIQGAKQPQRETGSWGLEEVLAGAVSRSTSIRATGLGVITQGTVAISTHLRRCYLG